MRAAAYLRVSTDGQTREDAFGLAVQREAIERWATSTGTEIVAWYTDAGVSGARLDRPALTDLVTDATGGAFAVVVVAKYDRVARDLAVQLWVETKLREAGCALVSVAEPHVGGDDPLATAMRQILGVFAQLEKSQIAQRMSGGRRQKARKGGYAGGGAPYGYHAMRGSKRLTVDEGQAETVRRLFALRDEGLTLRAVAARLNDEGHTTTQGKAFQAAQVKRVLDRRAFYSGRYSYAEIESKGTHEAVL